jgi:hypothetical protein
MQRNKAPASTAAGGRLFDNPPADARRTGLPFVQNLDAQPARRELRAGDLCPICGEERLDYDGLLNLSCRRCGTAVSGCFT